MNIAVVILNWNGKHLLEAFLPSVVDHSAEHDIYVVDNGSSDNSIDYIKNNHPKINIIKFSKNYGYAEGYNTALKGIKADVFCLLNSDVAVTKNWLNPIVECFKLESDVAIIQPKILDQKNPDTFEYAGAAGGFIDRLGYPYCRGRIFNSVEKDHGQYNDEKTIFWASGACFFIRSKAFNLLEGFDTDFFAYMEEIDLCWRAYNKGYNIKYVGRSSVFHVGGASLHASSPKKTYLNFRNSLFTLVKNAKGPLFILVLLRLILDGIAGIHFLILGKPKHTWAIIEAHGGFYKALPKTLHFRSKNPKRRGYFRLHSIVWNYFVLKISKFSKLKNH